MFQVMGHDWDLEVVLATFETRDEARRFMYEYEGEFPSLEIVQV